MHIFFVCVSVRWFVCLCTDITMGMWRSELVDIGSFLHFWVLGIGLSSTGSVAKAFAL